MQAMSSATIPIPSGPPSEPVFPLSVEQYHAMINAGVLTDDDPVELLEGILVFRMPKNPKHRITIAKLDRAISPRLPSDTSVQWQDPVTLSDGEPEPDFVVIRGQAEDYPDRHPGPVDVLLLVEVADTTLSRDRGIKLRSYARAGIAVYWIVNLLNRTVELYTNPDRTSSPPSYGARDVLGEQDAIPLEIHGVKIDIAVSAILP
jgi:Uma2 family endonuclease